MKVIEFLLSRERFTRREFVDSVDVRDPYALLRQLERWDYIKEVGDGEYVVDRVRLVRLFRRNYSS